MNQKPCVFKLYFCLVFEEYQNWNIYNCWVPHFISCQQAYKAYKKNLTLNFVHNHCNSSLFCWNDAKIIFLTKFAAVRLLKLLSNATKIRNFSISKSWVAEQLLDPKIASPTKVASQSCQCKPAFRLTSLL